MAGEIALALIFLGAVALVIGVVALAVIIIAERR